MELVMLPSFADLDREATGTLHHEAAYDLLVEKRQYSIHDFGEDLSSKDELQSIRIIDAPKPKEFLNTSLFIKQEATQKGHVDMPAKIAIKGQEL